MEPTPLPSEYRERAERFLREAEEKIFPTLQQEGFFCSGFTMVAGREETLREEELRDLTGMDQPDPELETLLDYKKKVEEAAAADRAKGVDRAEFLISGPSGKRAVIEATRSEFLTIALRFGGKENVWIIKESPSMRARMKEVDPSIVVPAGKESELSLLASYLFQG